MHRLFVGLRPPLAVREQLLAIMAGVPGARWQSDEQLHITLRFIGELDRPQAEDVAIALSNVRFPPIQLAVEGVGQFGSRGRTTALWAGVRPHGAVTDLHKKVDQALVRIGLAPEGRAYLPHITLARLNSASIDVEGFLQVHAGLTSTPFTLDSFLLFESHLGHAAASYEAIERYRLA